MKIKILILCAMVGLGFGCKKEPNQADRYKVFSASWDDVELPSGNALPEKRLVKFDSVTGQVWCWIRVIGETNDSGRWMEMTDTDFALKTK